MATLDTLVTGVWREISQLQDPELRRLAESLPKTALRSRVDSATMKYLYAFQRWKKWALLRKEVTVFLVGEVHFALNLQHLGETVRSKSAVEDAIGWLHQTAGLPSIAESPFIRAVLSGLQRKLAKPTVRKEPVTADMLSLLVGQPGCYGAPFVSKLVKRVHI